VAVLIKNGHFTPFLRTSRSCFWLSVCHNLNVSKGVEEKWSSVLCSVHCCIKSSGSVIVSSRKWLSQMCVHFLSRLLACTDNEKHSFIVLLQSYCRPFFVCSCIYSCDCRVLRLKAVAGGLYTNRANVTRTLVQVYSCQESHAAMRLIILFLWGWTRAYFSRISGFFVTMRVVRRIMLKGI
jgi:hypothetical protein